MVSRRSQNSGLGGIAVAATLSIFAAPAAAQDRAQGVSVGLGVAAGNGIFVGGDGEAGVLPSIRYDSDAVSVGLADGLRVTLFEQDALRFSAIVAPRFSAIDISDSPALDGFDREITADGGVQLRYSLGGGAAITARAVTELTDEHGGSEFALSISQPAPIGGIPVRFGAGVTWQSEDLAAYNFGVTPADAAASTFAPYNPGAVLIPHISVGASIPLSDRVSLVGSVRAEFFPDDITDSPIIDEDIGVGAFLGISYSF